MHRSSWVKLAPAIVIVLAAAARADEAVVPPGVPAGAAAPAADASGGPALDAEASVAVLNRYVFRGWRYGAAHGVVQPSLEVSRAGFTAGLWANLDLREEPTRAFAPHRPGEWSLNEVDVSLAYARTFGRVTLGAGWSWYRTWYAEPTQEVQLSASADLPGAPALTVFRDVDALPATYVSLALSHEVPLGERAALQLGAAFGWLGGDAAAWRTPAADGTPGAMYRAFHDGSVEAAVAFRAARATVRPSVQLVFPLSEAAGRLGFDPAGPVATTVVFGVAVAAGTEE